MSIDSSLEALKWTARDTAKITHRNDTDEQLRATVVRCARLAATSPMTQEGLLEAYKLMGEMEGCNALLEERRAARDALSAKKLEWRKERRKREDAALLALETAVSPNGQLVAAILEEENELPREQLRVWCDELAALDDESFEALMDGLEKEGVVQEEGDSYQLIAVCKEDLTWDREAIERCIREEFSYSDETAGNALLIVHLLEKAGEPLSREDILRLIGEEREVLALDPRLAPGLEMSEYAPSWIMERLAKAGALSKEYSHDGKDYYWFSLVGERRA